MGAGAKASRDQRQERVGRQYEGLKTRDYAEMIGGAIIVVALALATDALLALVARRLRARTHSFSDDEDNSPKESL